MKMDDSGSHENRHVTGRYRDAGVASGPAVHPARCPVAIVLAVVATWTALVLPDSSLAKLRDARVDSARIVIWSPERSDTVMFTPIFDLRIRKATWSEILWGAR